MRGKYSFREPLLIDDNGLYITAAQMQFFLNRQEGHEKFKSGDQEFMHYYKNCCLYNLIYDMMENNPDCGKMYWDEQKESVGISFPVKGEVSQALSHVSIQFEGEEDEDEDYEDSFGLWQ